MVVQAQEIEQITATLPGITIPALIIIKHLETRTQFTTGMMFLVRRDPISRSHDAPPAATASAAPLHQGTAYLAWDTTRNPSLLHRARASLVLPWRALVHLGRARDAHRVGWLLTALGYPVLPVQERAR